MGAHASFPERFQASSHSVNCLSHGYTVSENEGGRKEKKRKTSKFTTLRKKLTRVRRHSRSLDHTKIMRDMLSSWLVQDVIILVQEYEATAALKELSLAANLARPSAHSLRHDLARLYFCKFCTDVDLIYKNNCFPAHRAILSARSPFFKALLSRYPEYGAQVPVKLKTPGVDVTLFSSLLRYFYTDELGEDDINWENNEMLSRLAGEFGVPNLLEHDMKQLLESGEYSDAVLVFSVDSEQPEMASSYHHAEGFGHSSTQNVHGSHRSGLFEFPCHRAVLAARSPFFMNFINRRAKSGEELTERTLRTPTRIVLDESVIPKRYARVLLSALYQDVVDMKCVLRESPSMCSLSEVQAMVSSGRCQMTVVDEAMELYQIGRFLDAQVISQGCEDIIVDNLTADCLVATLNWSSEPHGSEWVHRQAMAYLAEEFVQISHSPVLLDLNKAYLKEVLASDFLQCGELDILSSLIRWGEHQLIKRIEEREPNLLSHTAHSVTKKGVKKRDLDDVELKGLLSELLPHVRVEHILPPNSEVLFGAVKRGLIELPPWHAHPDDAIVHRIGAWTGMTNSGAFLKPRLFTPFYDEAKNTLEELMSQGPESGSRVRTIHMSAIPDTLYMLESADVNLPLPYSGSPVSTVDIIAGTIPVPDRATFVKMLEREKELLQSKPAQRSTSLPCYDKRSLTMNAALCVQLRVVREFGLPDNAVEVLQNSQYYYTNSSCRRPRYHHHCSQPQQPGLFHSHQQPHSSFKRNLRRNSSPPLPHHNAENDHCSEGILSEAMPDIAMATANLSDIHLHEEIETELNDGSLAALYI